LANGLSQIKDTFVEVLQIRDELDYRRKLKEEKRFSLLSFIGNTPLIQIRRMTRHLRRIQIFAKAELKLAESIDWGVMVTIFPEGTDILSTARIVKDRRSGSRLNCQC
jgi:hypothetical protein